MQSKTENHTMRVFYLLAIVFVVDGHTTLGNLFDLNGLFRYYSFHLMMFAFGSGYFFKFYGGALSDFAHRAKKLLVPLYLWNVVYGVGAALLRRFGGFELGEPDFGLHAAARAVNRRSALRLEPRRVVHFSVIFRAGFLRGYPPPVRAMARKRSHDLSALPDSRAVPPCSSVFPAGRRRFHCFFCAR